MWFIMHYPVNKISEINGPFSPVPSSHYHLTPSPYLLDSCKTLGRSCITRFVIVSLIHLLEEIHLCPQVSFVKVPWKRLYQNNSKRSQ